MQELVITKDGLDRLSEELHRLKGERRRALVERLTEAAASAADRAENADYVEARIELGRLEERIARLEARLRSAQIVEPCFGNGRVDVGERVRVRDLDSGKRFEIELVGPLEADVSAGRVSVVSPLGKALLGLRRGEVADVLAPRGRLRFKVLAVEAPARAA
jgi:transcription elongation factor GreA